MSFASRPTRYSLADIVTVARMAGAGASAGEIAAALGRGATREHVYRLVHRYGIPLIHKARTQVCVPLVVSEESIETARKIAERMGEDPQWLAARIFENCITDRATVARVLEWIDPR